MTPDRPLNNPTEINELKKLNQIVEEGTESFSVSTFEHVREFVVYIHENPDKFKPWKILDSLDDFKLLHSVHDEWQGKSARELELGETLIAIQFVENFRRWAKRSSTDEDERTSKIESIFPTYKYPTTIEGWQDEFRSHPNWLNKSI